MREGEVRLVREGTVARVVFDRPQARNAMTWRMYDDLARICAELRADSTVRAVVLRGAGGEAFIAGTDIAQFRDFASGADGVAYEARFEAVLLALETLPMPTLAVVEGWAVGGGLAIAACCDFRIATPNARFGVPIARTLGNCLSVANTARLVAALGVPNAKRVLMLGDMVLAAEARASGFVLDVVEPADLEPRIAALTDRLARNAPITMRVGKEAVRRVVEAGLADDRDLVEQAYGSEDFRRGVAAFIEKREAQWTGR